MANSNSFGGAVGPVGMQHRTGTLGDSIANVRADIDAGFVALEAKTTSKRKSSVAQTSVISNDATEQTLFTLTFPANSLECGDWVYFWFNCEVTALASGELRMRTWVGTVGGTQLISGFLNRTSTGLTGFEYTKFMIVDTGAGPTAARFAGADFTGIDVVVDLSQELVINCTGQMTVADAGNAYRGVGAFMGAL